MTYLPLLGILIVVAGFALKLNPMLVVTGAGFATGLLAGMGPGEVTAAFGKAFNDARYVSLIYIVLPVIGILERHGLQERARTAIASLRGATVGRLLIGYLLFRQVTAALGLTSIAGPAQSVRPLVAPMAQAAAERQGADPESDRIPAMAAATDNVGLFFGEDIFIAIGSILLMVGVLHGFGIEAEPLELAKWAIPTALCAFAIHATRLWLLDRKLARERREIALGDAA
jgi:uncharacterized membrane protein